MPNQKNDIQRWKARKGATDARIATLLAEVDQRAESAYDAYFKRLQALLGQDAYTRLLEAWEAEQEAPADLVALMDADPEARRLYREAAHPLWLLSNTQHNGIPSEHYVYSQTGGKLRGPNGER
jgi:hypothetical protein